MHLPALNVNIVVIAVLLGLGLYGLVAGKQRLRILILSVYVGIVLASQMANIVSPTLHMLGQDQISWLLLTLPIFIFGLAGAIHANKHQKGAAIANIIVGILTGALIIAAGIHLLPTSEMEAVDNQSFIALNLGQFYLWILGLLPLVALVLGFMRSEKKKH